MKNISFFLFLMILNFSVFSQDIYYWVGGSGNWSDLNHWQMENGITPIAPPNESTSVIFNESSFANENDFVNIDDIYSYCNDMNWDNIPFNVWITGDYQIYTLFIFGSLRFHENLINDFPGSIQFVAEESGSKTIELNGVSFKNAIIFNGISGEWNLMDDLWMDNAALVENKGQIYLEHGHLNTNGQEIHCSSILSIYSNLRTLNIENSIIHLYEHGEVNCWEMDNENLSLLAEGSTIIIQEDQAKFVSLNGLNPQYENLFLNGVANIIENTGELYFQKIQVNGDFCNLGSNLSADSVIINGNGCIIGVGAEINNLEVNADQFLFPEGLFIKRLISAGQIDIVGPNYIEYGKLSGHVSFFGDNTFDTLILLPSFNLTGSNFYFQSGSTQTIIDSLRIRGNQCSNISLTAINPTELAYLKKDFGEFDVSCDFLVINNVGAQSETLNFYAGLNSTAIPNPEDPPPGWIFENDSNYTFGFCESNTEACYGDTIILDATCFNGDEETQYYWNGSTIHGEITFEVTETDTVSIIVVYAPSCFVVDYAIVEFDSCENNIDNNYLDKLLKIYPNPSNGILNLEITKMEEEFELALCNSLGIDLFQETVYPTGEITTKTFDFSYLETGIYYVRISFNGKVFVRKVIIY